MPKKKESGKKTKKQIDSEDCLYEKISVGINLCQHKHRIVVGSEEQAEKVRVALRKLGYLKGGN